MPTVPISSPPFFTVEEVADQLRVSHMTVRRIITAGELPAYRFGRSVRIDPADVDAYLERQRVSA